MSAEPEQIVPGLSSPADLDALVTGLGYVDLSEVAGDIAEFGCYAGWSAQIMAYEMANRKMARSLWLFDSFQGMPEATNIVDLHSPQVRSGAWGWKAQISPTQVRSLCAQFLPLAHIKIIPGWYKDTLASLPTETRFALVNIDCDLYESTLQVLDYLFAHRMFSDGCALFFNDWYCNRGSPRFGEQRAWAEVNKDGYSFTDVGAYATMGRKFILHRDDSDG